MPLFPISESQAKDEASNRLSLGRGLSSEDVSAVASTATEGWLRVGQSYGHVPAAKEDHISLQQQSHEELGKRGGPQVGHTDRPLLGDPPVHPRHAARRCKAADFFGVEEGAIPTADVRGMGEPPESSLVHLAGESIATDTMTLKKNYKAKAKRKRKKRSSSLSDSESDSSRDTRSRHRKTKVVSGRQRSSKGRDRSRGGGGKASRKSRKNDRHRTWHSSKPRSSRDSSGDTRSEDSSSDERTRSSRRRPKPAPPGGQQPFVEDRRGDRDNLSFGKFYRLDVPVYHGMNEAARRREPRRSARPGNALRYFGNQARSANGDGHLERVQLWKGDKRRDHAMSWTLSGAAAEALPKAGEMPVLAKDNGRRTGHEHPRGSADFLPVDPVVSLDEHATESDITGRQEGVYTESLGQWVTRRTKEFNLVTREKPDCEDTWLQYADFQGEAVRAVHGGGYVQSTSAILARTIREKQVSVLEGALRRNPLSIRLRIAQLHLAGQLQEHDVVDSLWRGAMEKSNHSGALWLPYLQFKAGHFASFSVPNQRSTYARCVQALESKREETRKAYEMEQRSKGVFIMGGRSMLGDCKDHILAEKRMLDVVWSYCIMEKAAGYQERALGVLQALVELNIQSQSTVSMDTLEAFWDSETPRIGDEHPSLSGLSRWEETMKAEHLKRSEQRIESKQEGVVVARRPTDSRPPTARGKRKRAVDFFEDKSTAATKQTRAGGSSLMVRAEQSDGAQGARLGQSKGTDGPDVLETAYHAAMALAARPTPHTDAFSAVDHAPIQKANASLETSGLRPESYHPDEGRAARSPREDLSEPARSPKENPSTQDASEQTTGIAGSVGKGEPGTASDKGAKAVDAEGLIWVDESQATAYSVRHGYRIDVQGAQDSVSGLEYGRILHQMREGDTAEGHAERDVEAAAAASKRLRSRGARERDAEMAKQAAVLQDVPEDDAFSAWAKSEDGMTRHQWQPLRSTVDAEKAEDQPDRVIFVEDLKPFLFNVSQPASLRTLVGFLLSAGGVVFPRSHVSHSPALMSEACSAGTFGDGGLSSCLISALSNGLQSVWSASGSSLPVRGRGVIRCTGRKESCLPALVVSTTADQFLLLTDEVVGDPSRQTFLRNALHLLIRTPEALPTGDAKPAVSSGANAWGSHGGDVLVQLQCTLIMFEGYLASAAGARRRQTNAAGNGQESTDAGRRSAVAWSDEDIHGHEARKVAKALLEASQASATDLRLWSSYVQLLALLGSRQEAINVAEKALSMVQALPEDKKSLSAELFWFAFRLHAGLPLSPRDPHPGVDNALEECDRIEELFKGEANRRHGNHEMALLVLCSFAEGSFKRPKTKKSKRQGNPSSSETAGITPPRLMAARKLMAGHVARMAGELLQEGTDGGVPNGPEGALDMTTPFMYYAVAWVWLEYLTRGHDAAEETMTECLGLARNTTTPKGVCKTGCFPLGSDGEGLNGNKAYTWDVVPEHAALGVCLERMHRAFGELLVLAQRFNPVATGPRKVRAVLLRGLRSFPAEPGMLCMLSEAEQFSSSQQRLVHHLFEVSRRRVLDWEQGPTPPEWIFFTSNQVMRCVHEARQLATASGDQMGSVQKTETACEERDDNEALRVKNWLPGSYSRLKRFMESAVTHPTGRGIPILWRMYMSLEAMRGNHTQAKQLFWRAIHACPGNKAVWMDALRGDQRARMGAAGLRPAFRAKELNEILDGMLEKALHLRAEPP